MRRLVIASNNFRPCLSHFIKFASKNVWCLHHFSVPHFIYNLLTGIYSMKSKHVIANVSWLGVELYQTLECNSRKWGYDNKLKILIKFPSKENLISSTNLLLCLLNSALSEEIFANPLNKTLCNRNSVCVKSNEFILGWQKKRFK